MSLDALIIKARSLSDRDAADFLGQLARDERWPALIKLIDEHREDYIEAASKQSHATHAGVQAHALGSVFALKALLEVLAAASKPPKSRRKQSAPDEES